MSSPALGASAGLLLALFLSASLGVGPSFAATAVDGLWRAASGGAVLEFHSCGDALCGRLVRSTDLDADPLLRDGANHNPALRDRPIRDLDILHGFRGGPVAWTDGRIYDPGSGRTYTAALRLVAPDRVKLTGCLIYPVCGSQVWRKVP